MDKLVSHDVYRVFAADERLFTGLGGDAVATLAAGSCDLALVLSAGGEVLDTAFKDRSLKVWKPESWVGRPLMETVTAESREKIRELLQESAHWPLTRPRQVNHPAPGSRDLPVSYRLCSFAGWPYKLAIGEDLRAMADMQQRFVRHQVEMERDYRKLRDTESRYRVLFVLSREPLAVVESHSLKILDANEAMEQLFDRPLKRLVGSQVTSLFARGDVAPAAEQLAGAAAEAKVARFTAALGGRDDPVEVSVTPFREFGRTSLLVGFGTENGLALGSRGRELRLSAIVESLPDGVVLANEEGLIVGANAAFLDLVRVVSMDRLIDRSLDNWLGASSVDVQVLMANLREHGLVRRFSTVIRDNLGGTESVEVSAAVIQEREGRLFGFSIREAQAVSASNGDGVGMPQSVGQFTELVGRVPLKDLVRDTADTIEKLCIEAALKLTNNNRASAADMLGLSRQSLYIKLRRFGLSDFNGEDEI